MDVHSHSSQQAWVRRESSTHPLARCLCILFLVTIWQVWLGATAAHAQAVQPDGAAACPASFSTGGGACISGPVVLSQQQQAILSQKNVLAREYAQVRAGTMNAAPFQR